MDSRSIVWGYYFSTMTQCHDNMTYDIMTYDNLSMTIWHYDTMTYSGILLTIK
jgi:hypothetical protein